MAENAKASGLAVGAWVLYDLSNTVFAVVGSVVFGFLTDRIGRRGRSPP
jgi:MFS family permease